MSNAVEVLFLFPQRLHSPLLAKNHFLSVPDHILLALHFLDDHTNVNKCNLEGWTYFCRGAVPSMRTFEKVFIQIALNSLN